MSIITINEHAHGDDGHHFPAPPAKRDDWFYQSFDARIWALAFCEVHPDMDRETMEGWFANALMRGYDEGRYR